MLALLTRDAMCEKTISGCYGCSQEEYSKGIIDISKDDIFKKAEKDTETVIIYIENDSPEYTVKFTDANIYSCNITRLNKDGNLKNVNVDFSNSGNVADLIVIDGVNAKATSNQPFKLKELTVIEGSEITACLNSVEHVLLPENNLKNLDLVPLRNLDIILNSQNIELGEDYVVLGSTYVHLPTTLRPKDTISIKHVQHLLSNLTIKDANHIIFEGFDGDDIGKIKINNENEITIEGNGNIPLYIEKSIKNINVKGSIDFGENLIVESNILFLNVLQGSNLHMKDITFTSSHVINVSITKDRTIIKNVIAETYTPALFINEFPSVSFMSIKNVIHVTTLCELDIDTVLFDLSLKTGCIYANSPMKVKNFTVIPRESTSTFYQEPILSDVTGKSSVTFHCISQSLIDPEHRYKIERFNNNYNLIMETIPLPTPTPSNRPVISPEIPSFNAVETGLLIGLIIGPFVGLAIGVAIGFFVAKKKFNGNIVKSEIGSALV